MAPAKRKVVEAALRERAERLERELAVERAARLAQERCDGKCLGLLPWLATEATGRGFSEQ